MIVFRQNKLRCGLSHRRTCGPESSCNAQPLNGSSTVLRPDLTRPHSSLDASNLVHSIQYSTPPRRLQLPFSALVSCSPSSDAVSCRSCLLLPAPARGALLRIYLQSAGRPDRPLSSSHFVATAQPRIVFLLALPSSRRRKRAHRSAFLSRRSSDGVVFCMMVLSCTPLSSGTPAAERRPLILRLIDTAA